MTTLEPGARVVLTHGLRSSPASTALRATGAAPIMTDGLEVLVHEVMAAMTTEPWSTCVWVPSSRVAEPGLEARRAGGAAPAGGPETGGEARGAGPAAPAGAAAATSCFPFSPASSPATGSDAGKVL